jgi:hypothetical protein
VAYFNVKGFIMNQLSNVFAEVVGGLERNTQGSVLPVVILANEVLGGSDRSVLQSCASDWSDGVGKEQAGVALLNGVALKLSVLLKRNGVDVVTKLPSFAWYTEVSGAFKEEFMAYEGLEDFQRNTADKAWSRAYERAGFNAVPKATNKEAVKEAERKAKIKLAKDQAIGKALSDAKQDISQAISNANARGDYATLELLTAKAKAESKVLDKKAGEALKPQKDAICALVRSCNNKATLDKVAKLLG